ncbi:MAG TPA: hypothetical protein VK184_00075 [Nostocaceae cyanobacterium]|nr:hypothetical protein [Nostocaceae cyanobacterium]
MKSSTLQLEEIEKVNSSTIHDIGEVIDYLNQCLDYSFNTQEEKERLDFISKIAEAKGISISELRVELCEARDKWDKALLLSKELTQHPDNIILNIALNIQVFNLIADSICIFWDFLSDNARTQLKELAYAGYKVSGNINVENWQGIENIVKEYKQAMQRFVNSVFGAVEWKDCETQLGRKLFYLRQKIILSGEPLITETELEQYLQERELFLLAERKS